MKRILFIRGRSLVAGFLMTFAILCPMTMMADDGMWRKTIIVKTLDGGSMEYLIDKNTKVKIEKPNLIIETEGVVLTYELENMSQVRYGKRQVPTGVGSLKPDNATPFKMKDEMLFFNDLKENTLINIYTADGKTISSRHYTGNAQISLSDLPAGVYFVKMNNETYKIVKK